MRRSPSWLLILFLLLLPLAGAPASAAMISRTITIDGIFTDWDGTGGTYSPPGDITNNTGQFNTDCQSGTSCERDGSLSSNGRDLKKFAFTWDNNNLYFYVERWLTASNATDWWFYMDTNGDGKMETGEKVIHVKWTGSNGSTTVDWATYTQAASGGDPIVGPSGYADGYTMPGSVGAVTNIYVAGGGDTTTSQAGLRMEVRVPWSLLGGIITNMNFHISSSNGSNLPTSVIDNMDGPNGDQLFPSDLAVGKTASQSTLAANATFTYTVTVQNVGYQSFTGVALQDVLPAQVSYVSYTASAGSYVDTNGDGIPDTWNIGTIAAQTGATLTVTVRAGNVTATTTTTNTASLSSFTGNDYTASDNSASATVTINPSPLLSVTKLASSTSVNPGQTVQYTVNITNTGYGVATAVTATDTPGPFLALGLNTYGTGQPFQLVQGSPSSGLALGTPQYSKDGGTTWTYVPVSGGGGAPTGYDGNVTNFRIPFTGSFAGGGASLLLRYQSSVK